MFNSKIVFMSLLISLSGCLKAQKNAGDNTDKTQNPGNASDQNSQTGNDGNSTASNGTPSQGSNQVGPIQLVDTHLSLSLNLVAPGTVASAPTVYADVSGIISSKCAVCHNAETSPRTNLSRFPFQRAGMSAEA